ncbi:MAG TPA: hypothetical protein V6C81_05875 [Planktothrix sp.]
MTEQPTNEGNPPSQDRKQPDPQRSGKARFMDVNSVLSVMGKTVKECTTTDPPSDEDGQDQAETCMIKAVDVPLPIDIKPGKGSSAQVQPLFKDPVPTADLGKDFDPFKDLPRVTGGSLTQEEISRMYKDVMSQEVNMQIDTGVINLNSFPKPLKLQARITNSETPQRVEVPRRNDSKHRLESMQAGEQKPSEPTADQSKFHKPVSGLLAKLVRKPADAQKQQQSGRGKQEEIEEKKSLFQRTIPQQPKHETGLVDLTRINTQANRQHLEPVARPPAVQTNSGSTADSLPVVQQQNDLVARIDDLPEPAQLSASPQAAAKNAPAMEHFDTGVVDVSAINVPHPMQAPTRPATDWKENQSETGRVDIRQIRELSQRIAPPAPAPAPAAPMPIREPVQVIKPVQTVPLIQTQQIAISMHSSRQPLLHVTASGLLEENISFIGMQHCIQIISSRRTPRAPQPAAVSAGQPMQESADPPGSQAKPGFLQGMMKKLGLE